MFFLRITSIIRDYWIADYFSSYTNCSFCNEQLCLFFVLLRRFPSRDWKAARHSRTHHRSFIPEWARPLDGGWCSTTETDRTSREKFCVWVTDKLNPIIPVGKWSITTCRLDGRHGKVLRFWVQLSGSYLKAKLSGMWTASRARWNTSPLNTYQISWKAA